MYDQDRIMQVMTNLIKNSLVAVQPNTGKIEIVMENLPTEIKINIKDKSGSFCRKTKRVI